MQIGYRIYYRLYRPDGAGTTDGSNSTTEQWQTKELQLHTVASVDSVEPMETVLKGLKRYTSIEFVTVQNQVPFAHNIRRNINKFYYHTIIRFYCHYINYHILYKARPDNKP